MYNERYSLASRPKITPDGLKSISQSLRIGDSDYEHVVGVVLRLILFTQPLRSGRI